MKALRKWTAVLLIIAIVVLLNSVGSYVPGKVDLTAQKLYTLSDGSKAILDKLSEPITLKYYFSRSLDTLPIYVKNYATRVEDMLRNYQRASGGRIRLELIDPKPDTAETEEAISQGLTGQPLQTGETVYFGLVAQCADQQQAIPFIAPQREPFIEYDISQLIYQVQNTKRPKLGIITALPIFGDFRNMRSMQEMPREYVFVSELRKRYEVTQVTGDTLPGDLDVLAVIQPGVVSEPLEYDIDQFILSGKPVFIAVDPSSVVQKQGMQQQMMMGGASPGMGSSNLPRLFEKYGIDYDPNRIVGDRTFATRIQMDRNLPPLPIVTYLTMDAFPPESPASSELKTMNFIESGYFSLKPDSGLTLNPLAVSSTESGTLATDLLMANQPDEIVKFFKSDGQVRTIAGIVSGKFKTAFPEGKPKPAPKEGETTPAADPTATDAPALKESTGKSTLVLVADTDFITDTFSVRVANAMGYMIVQPINDNLAFVSNTVDLLAGSQDLISLRGKGVAQRPFKLVLAMEQKAQLTYQAREDELKAKRAEVEAELTKLQDQYKNVGALVAPPEVEAAIEKYSVEKARIGTELREIRKKLREKVEDLQLTLSAANLLAAPLLITAFGIAFFIERSKRQKSKRA
ncbi:MAG: GldG family protein [Verrucomicrobiota bacterium]|nr:GldG family protein [Verrucomicrobiota bacterium]